MLAGHVLVLSGVQQHNFDKTDIHINEQGGDGIVVYIGQDYWICDGSLVVADIAPGSDVGAGSVVNKTLDSYSIISGVPVKVIGMRKGLVRS